MAEELQTARDLLVSGDISRLLLDLRVRGDALPLGEVAQLVTVAPMQLPPLAAGFTGRQARQHMSPAGSGRAGRSTQ